MDLTTDDLLKILKIINESQYDDVRLETGRHKLHVQKERSRSPEAATGQPAAAERAATSPVEQWTNNTAGNENSFEGPATVRAPMLGILHLAASPEEKPRVQVGDRVGPGDALGSIDVLGLLNPITAGVGGTVVQILAEHQSLVEYGQPLMLIAADRPDRHGEVLH